MTTQPTTQPTTPITATTTVGAFTGPLDGLAPGALLSWGLLEVLSLFPAREPADRARFVAPLEYLKLINVPTYGTVVLRNTASQGLLIAPMHIGFFQDGAQNHATSRVLIFESGELLEVNDCFCVQQSQGGLLKE